MLILLYGLLQSSDVSYASKDTDYISSFVVSPIQGVLQFETLIWTISNEDTVQTNFGFCDPNDQLLLIMLSSNLVTKN